MRGQIQPLTSLIWVQSLFCSEPFGVKSCHTGLGNGFKTKGCDGPGQVAQLVRASSPYAKVAGSIPGQDTYKNQPMSTSISGTTN